MTVMVTHNPKDRVYSSFGATLDKAKAASDSLAANLKASGNHVQQDSSGEKLRDGVYGWNLLVKKKVYS